MSKQLCANCGLLEEDYVTGYCPHYGGAYNLHTFVERHQPTDRIETKHDPYCDCGICQYCNGDEDKHGNPTRGSAIEIAKIRREVEILAVIGCSECTESKTDTLYSVDLTGFRLQFAQEVWKYGWIVEANKVLCPNCRADAEEWRSI